jgi:hypothetical protein
MAFLWGGGEGFVGGEAFAGPKDGYPEALEQIASGRLY